MVSPDIPTIHLLGRYRIRQFPESNKVGWLGSPSNSFLGNKMGCHKNISISKFPKQGNWLNLRTEVCFHYDTSKTIMGTIIRDDKEEPGITLIRLDDGRVVLGTECHHSPKS